MSDLDLLTRFEAAQEIAREAGLLALKYFRDPSSNSVQSKGIQNEASDADRAVEDLIREKLMALFPDDAVLGEERGNSGEFESAAGIWVVDPIDGTACFVNGIPVWCVSIAYLVGDTIEIGVIYDPNADELFTARGGHGAYLNGIPITPSTAKDLRRGGVGIGYSTRVKLAPVIAALERLVERGGMFQRNGSGALMITYVAAGRLLGYYEPHINSWDCLAGIALVREAGGWCNDFLADNGLTKGNAIIAAAPGLAQLMREVAGVEETPTI